MLSNARIQATDRRRAAIHEAGHIVIAHHYGVEAWGEITKSVAPGPHETTWSGCARIHQEAYLPAEGWFDVSVAGALAEFRFTDPGDYDWVFDDPDAVLMSIIFAISPTDRQLSGLRRWPRRTDTPSYWMVHQRLEKTASLVRRLWPEIWSTSRVLIQQRKEIRAAFAAVLGDRCVRA